MRVSTQPMWHRIALEVLDEHAAVVDVAVPKAQEGEDGHHL